MASPIPRQRMSCLGAYGVHEYVRLPRHGTRDHKPRNNLSDPFPFCHPRIQSAVNPWRQTLIEMLPQASNLLWHFVAIQRGGPPRSRNLLTPNAATNF